MKFILTFTLWLSSFSVYAATSAKIQGLIISAQTMSRDADSNTIELLGDIQIAYKTSHMSAQKAVINLNSRQIDMTGNAKYIDERVTVGGTRIIMDYESETGLIYDGYVQSGSVMFEGALLQKNGKDQYFVILADYTTCTNCPSTWSFTGSSIRAEIGGYAYIKNALLRIGGIPFLPLPYLVVPLKSDRQSGLLTPGFEQSSAGGLALAQPYFWAISRNTDATITLKNYEKRGLKGLLNYRFVLSELSQGELDLGTLRDRVFADDGRLKTWRPDSQDKYFDRWFLKYNHYLELPHGWVQRMSVNNSSDLQYQRDFPKETLNHGDPAMETRVSLTKNTQDTHFSIDSSYYTNLLQGNPLASSDDSVQRLPEIRFAQLPLPISKTGFYYSFDVNSTNFSRTSKGYDNLTAKTADGKRYLTSTCTDPSQYGSDPSCKSTDDGVFDPYQDLIRTGHRLDFHSTLSYPVELFNAVDLLPQVSYRETKYNFNVDQYSTNNRKYIRGELASRMSFSRIYGDLADPKSTRWKHEIRPEIRYTYLPWIDHQSHPFFGFKAQTEAPTFENSSLSDEDLFGDTGIQFDYKDRIYDRNLVTYSIVNTVTEKKWESGIPIYKQIAFIKLSQSFDQWKKNQNDPKKPAWSDIALQSDLRLDKITLIGSYNYYPEQKVTNSTTRVKYMTDSQRFVEFRLNRSFRIVPGEPVDSTTKSQEYAFSGGFISRYLNLMGRLTYNDTASTQASKLKSWTYIAQIKPPGNCWFITLIHDQQTGGGPNLELNFEFNFDGTTRPTLSPAQLNKYGF